jgi:hypothetical protein
MKSAYPLREGTVHMIQVEHRQLLQVIEVACKVIERECSFVTKHI